MLSALQGSLECSQSLSVEFSDTVLFPDKATFVLRREGGEMLIIEEDCGLGKGVEHIQDLGLGEF